MQNNIAKTKWFNNAQVLVLALALVAGTWGVSEYMNAKIIDSRTWVRVVKHVDESSEREIRHTKEVSAVEGRLATVELRADRLEKLLPEINRKLSRLDAIEGYLRGSKVISFRGPDGKKKVTYN